MTPSDDQALLLEEQADKLTARILDAAFAEVSAYGLRRTSMENVARRAGIARATIYRRFENKNDLFRSVALREAQRAMVSIGRAIEQLTTIEERLIEGFVMGIRFARQDSLLARLLSTEPETMLPYLTIDSGFGLAVGRKFLTDLIRHSPQQRAVADPEAAAEVILRLIGSLVLAPHSCIPIESDDELRTFARRYLLPILNATT